MGSIEAFSVEDQVESPATSRGAHRHRWCALGTMSLGALALTALAFGGAKGFGERAMTARTTGAPLRSRAPQLSAGLAPLLGDGTSVEWWFAFKPTTAAFPRCSTNVTCMFGGDPMEIEEPPRFGLQYILASSDGIATKEMQLHSDCLGNGEDPLAKTFQQIYSSAANYVLWNDQFYDDPVPDVDPPCVKYCAKPWGHSKGAMAWQEDGSGFVLQVTTPDWPGSGSSQYPRKEQGNTLGCCEDDNIMVAQHFFALRLNSVNDTLTILQALQRASVVTDPKNPQLVKLSSGPSELQQVAAQLGQQVLDVLEPFQGRIAARSGTGVALIAKPSGLQVPPWHLISSLLDTPLRTASWWTKPAINSTRQGFRPGCWHSSLKPSTPEVQVALSGQWQNMTFSLLGVPNRDGNHAKLAHSLAGRKLAVMGDMNQQGALDPDNPEGTCDLSQNARGGLFFVVEDAALHAGLVELMTGETAEYVTDGKLGCGGAGVIWTNCKRSGCTYVKKADVVQCKVSGYGCYNVTQLPPGCQTDVNELRA